MIGVASESNNSNFIHEAYSDKLSDGRDASSFAERRDLKETQRKALHSSSFNWIILFQAHARLRAILEW